MASLLLALLLLVGTPAQAGCDQVDSAVIDSHAGWAVTAWREGDDARFGEVYQLLLEDLACVAGSGLKTRNVELFLVLGRGSLDLGDETRALAALRAALVIQGDYTPDPAMVPFDQPLAPLFAMAQVMGPDVAGFKELFLGQEPAATTVPPPAPDAPTPEELEALRREELLERIRHEREMDRKAHRAGAVTASLGGIVCGVSLALIAARQTSGERKQPSEELRPHRELYGKIWTGTAIGGAATMGLGLWLMRVSALDAGTTVPVVGFSGRF